MLYISSNLPFTPSSRRDQPNTFIMCGDYPTYQPVTAGQQELNTSDSKKLNTTTISTMSIDSPFTPVTPSTPGNTVTAMSDSLKEDSDVMRGFIGDLNPCVVKGPQGITTWDNDSYSFLSQECPTTANPKLWEQSRRSAAQGLFEVVPGVYQVRGLDLSNMTLIEGTTGVIVIDPLITHECAAAALQLYYKHRGEKPVTAIMYSHSHADHYGGAGGVLPFAKDKDIPIIAPDKFMQEVLSENVFAGPAMMRRGAFMYGARLPKSPAGQIGCGLGMTTSLGTTTIEAPNLIIKETGEEHIFDGVKFVFQMVPDTEAPAELNFHLPDLEALYIAECATYGMHNIVTLRGALVRDAKAWAKYLDESMTLFCNDGSSPSSTGNKAKSKVLFAGHLWPTFGPQAITQHLSEQRDLYTFLHDQTLRLMNTGMTGAEIAEIMTLPPGLEDRIHAQGFYGSISHNVKGIYQRYMGWFDGNPAHLWQHTPKEEAVRYVECMGGVDNVLAKAGEYIAKKDLRFAATLLNHAVQVEPRNPRARGMLSTVYEQLGYGAENATWRNFYLTGAMILKMQGPPPKMPIKPRFAPKASVEQWLDVLSVQFDGFQCGREELVVYLRVEDQKRAWRVNVSHGALTRREVAFEESKAVEDGQLVVTLAHRELFAVLATGDLRIVQARADRKDISALEKILRLSSVLEAAS